MTSHSGELPSGGPAHRGKRASVSIGEAMTRGVHVMQADETMAKAYGLMWAHRIRHVPVLSEGRIVGIVSETDLHFARALREIDPGTVPVKWVMTSRPCVVAPETSLLEVVRTMEEHKHDAVVIARNTDVLGIFTVTDALRELGYLLTRPLTDEYR